MDGLLVEGERRFTVGARADGAVQVGGVNVHPAAVAARLAQHPGVRDAAVRLMRPDEGSRLKAFVVPIDPAADPEPLRAALAAWIDAQLPAAERPRALSFGAELPRNPMGKPADW
jgi:acyl-coenzyme A synthetase/AMP-(fatty) acid ligase